MNLRHLRNMENNIISSISSGRWNGWSRSVADFPDWRPLQIECQRKQAATGSTKVTPMAIAASVNGLHMSQWRNDTNSSASQSVADGVDQLAKQKNVSGTPTILIGPTGGKLQVASGNTYDPQGVSQALAERVYGYFRKG